MSKPPPAFGDAEFRDALLREMPTGRAWRSDLGAMIAKSLEALAPTYRRSTEAAAQLLVDSNVATTLNLLDEWEKSLGLPDPCTPLDPSLQERQAAVRARWGARGGLTTGYFITLAAALGFTITIDEFRPFHAGSPAGTPLYGPAWAFAWRVNAPQVTTFRFAAGHSAAGDPLSTYDAPELICRISRDAPAGTVVIFAFS
jgi:uncharacterized protein YmfQ (DUF2313 family)